MTARISIFEVAKKAGCSIATISNVLNGKGRVSKEKRKKILKIVSSMDYRVNSAGRNLRTRRTETLGLLFYPSCAELFRNPFYAQVMEGLEKRLSEAGYHLLLASHESTNSKSGRPDILRSGKIDGVILLGRFPSKTIQVFHELKTPLLLLDSNVEWPVDSVVSDGFSAGLQTVRYLKSKGHRKIVMMAYDWEDSNIDLRIQGFLAGMKENGLPTDSKSVIRTALFHHDLYPALKARLEKRDPPTALITVNDTLAVVMMQKLAADGFRVPEQLSVVGYDDDEIGMNSSPSLTSIKVDKIELGRIGADLILKRINTPEDPVAKMRLPVQMVLRDSVAVAP